MVECTAGKTRRENQKRVTERIITLVSFCVHNRHHFAMSTVVVRVPS